MLLPPVPIFCLAWTFSQSSSETIYFPTQSRSFRTFATYRGAPTPHGIQTHPCPVWSLCTLLQHMLVVRMLRVLTEAVFGRANGRWALLSLFFLYCLYFLICFVLSMHALHLYQEKNYFWFLETLVVAMSRKVSLKGSTEFWALLLNLTPPQHLPFPALCHIYIDLRVLCRYS